MSETERIAEALRELHHALVAIPVDATSPAWMRVARTYESLKALLRSEPVGDKNDLHVCPDCHVLGEFENHRDDVPRVCPNCGGPWKVWRLAAEPVREPVWRSHCLRCGYTEMPCTCIGGFVASAPPAAPEHPFGCEHNPPENYCGEECDDGYDCKLKRAPAAPEAEEPHAAWREIIGTDPSVTFKVFPTVSASHKSLEAMQGDDEQREYFRRVREGRDPLTGSASSEEEQDV